MTMLTNIDRNDSDDTLSCDFLSELHVDQYADDVQDKHTGNSTLNRDPTVSQNSIVNGNKRKPGALRVPFSNGHAEKECDNYYQTLLPPREDKDDSFIQASVLSDIGTTSSRSEGTEVLRTGPNVDIEEAFQQDEDGDTLLHIALIMLSLDLALYIIDRATSFTCLNIKNKLFQTPLHLAVLTKQSSLVRRLVVGGADIEARDQDGNMPIHVACRENQLNTVRALLDTVSPEEQKLNNYETPSQHTARTLGAKNYEGLPCLHIAALRNNLEVVKLLVEYGADIDERAQKSGRTILHEAAWSGNVQLVKFIVSIGRKSDINATTYDDYTAFDLARSRGHWSIVMELAAAGAKYADEKDLEY